jgi:hypothetical protein
MLRRIRTTQGLPLFVIAASLLFIVSARATNNFTGDSLGGGAVGSVGNEDYQITFSWSASSPGDVFYDRTLFSNTNYGQGRQGWQEKSGSLNQQNPNTYDVVHQCASCTVQWEDIVCYQFASGQGADFEPAFTGHYTTP